MSFVSAGGARTWCLLRRSRKPTRPHHQGAFCNTPSVAADDAAWAGAPAAVARELAALADDDACARAALACARDLAAHTGFGPHLLVAAGAPEAAAACAELRPQDAERQRLACALFSELFQYPRVEPPQGVSPFVPWGTRPPEAPPLAPETGGRAVDL